ncbi:hypothetical protein [Streptomyces sp. NPDC001743]|uniref:hypothetical protein n=1 Tax=Streptomyces sp. NPDC001743 TaxID=3154397 RepID=UPI00331A0E2A
MSDERYREVEARLERLETVLGLQKLDAKNREAKQDDVAGGSYQSNHCGGSALSVVCAAEAMDALQ